MPIEHIGIDLGPAGVRLVRVEAGFGWAAYSRYETRPLGEGPVPEGVAEPPPGSHVRCFEPHESGEVAAASPEEEGGAPEAEDDEEADDELPPEEQRLPWTDTELALQRSLGALSESGAFESQFTALALPSTQITTRVLSFPFAARKKIEMVLAPELEGLTPFDTGELLLEPVVLETLGKQGTRLLCYAGERNLFLRTLACTGAGGLEPRIVSVAGGALAALPIAVPAQDLPATEETERDEEHPPAPDEKVDAAAYLSRYAKGDAGKKEEAKEARPAGERTLLKSVPCAALLYLSELESTLVVLREGTPWLVHSSSFTVDDLVQNAHPSLKARTLGKEIGRMLNGFEANFALRPPRLLVLGAGAGKPELLRALAEQAGIPAEPARLDAAAVGEEGARLLERNPEAALAFALAYQSARATKVPAPNFRRGAFAFRSRWKDLTEPLFAPAAIALALVLLFLINSLLAFGNYKKQSQLARAQLRQIYKEARGSEPPPDPVAALRHEVEEKRQRLEIFRKISGISILNILAELSRSVKGDVEIDFENFQIDNDRVSINGRTGDYASIDKIQGYLEASPLFQKVEFRDAVPAPDQKIKFRLALTLSTADEDEESGEAEEAAAEAAPAIEYTEPTAEQLAPQDETAAAVPPTPADPAQAPPPAPTPAPTPDRLPTREEMQALQEQKQKELEERFKQAVDQALQNAGIDDPEQTRGLEETADPSETDPADLPAEELPENRAERYRKMLERVQERRRERRNGPGRWRPGRDSNAEGDQ